MGTFQADHLLLNVHYSRSNKIKNDKEDAARKLAQEETVKSGTNLFDLEERVCRGASAYVLLVAEFQPCGDLRDHTIVKSLNQAKKVKKQKWSKINHLISFLISLLFVFLLPIYYHISQSINIQIMSLSGTASLRTRKRRLRRMSLELTDLGKQHGQLSARAKVLGVPG